MPDGLQSLNVVEVGDSPLLLTEAGGGTTIHLTRRQTPGGREAVERFYLDDDANVPTVRNYDRTALLEPQWSPRTLCGREWVVMASSDIGALTVFSEPVFAPTCKRCLASMDRYFPAPPQHERLDLVVEVLADIVCRYGYAEIHGVPGDQQATLRKKARMEVRRRTGHSCTTFALNSMILISCDPIFEQRPADDDRAALERLDAFLSGSITDPRPDVPPDWRVWWSTWTAG